MAQRPIPGQFGWGADLNDHLDVSLNSDGTLREDVLAATSPVAVLRQAAPFADALDIWDGFNAGGSGPGWDDTNATTYISGLEAHFASELSDGSLVRTDHGLAGDDTHHIYSYTAGPAGAPTVAIVAGMHPEYIGIAGAMRFVEQFLRSDHPVMQALRRSFRIVWVPILNPYGFTNAEYHTATGVNISRNFDYWWDSHDSAVKGPTAESEPETQVVRDIVLDEQPSLLFDCHNLGSATGTRFEYTLAPTRTLLNRHFMRQAMQRWRALYDPDAELAFEEHNPGNAYPYTSNWAAYAMRWINGDTYSAATTLECATDLYGTSGKQVSQAAVRAYAGALTTIMLTWLDGVSAQHPLPYPYGITMYRHAAQADTSITAGGGLLDTNDPTIVQWINQHPYFWSYGDADTSPYVPVPYAPALLQVRANGTIRTDPTASDAAALVEVGVVVNGSRINATTTYCHLPATTNLALPPDQPMYGHFTCEGSLVINDVSTDFDNLVQLEIDVVYGGGDKMVLDRCTMAINVYPNTDEAPTPPSAEG